MIINANTGMFRPVDRDYNKHGKKRVEQLEIKTDGISYSLLTHGQCYAVILFEGK